MPKLESVKTSGLAGLDFLHIPYMQKLSVLRLSASELPVAKGWQFRVPGTDRDCSLLSMPAVSTLLPGQSQSAGYASVA